MRRKKHLTSVSDEELGSQHKFVILDRRSKYIKAGEVCYKNELLKELQSATSDFSEDYLVGIEMLGKVYKAFLPNGWTLAVKKINDWEYLEDDFVPEITTLGGLRHRCCTSRADIDLLGKGVDNLILQFLELACQCVKFFPNERPTMLEVYDTVKNISQGRRDWI
ncbi:hypothetical protein CQW23_16786 [Capsicum baccatum]|uniref:non-specific serine/threonine protein kinase n=1 Tax=Capsicum baccatum TaxID=33114 RepID=A0A2G2WBY2_CAPBA|nr:hypothetical protein CQW23_16786 [Capsicum baccatum]